MTIRRLGIIGDVHAEDARLALALDYLLQAQPDAIVCTGDVVDGSGCPDASAKLLSDAQVLVVRGNHDRWVVEDKARHIPDAHFFDNLLPDTQSFLQGLPSQLSLATIAGPLLLCHGVGRYDLHKVWPGSERMPPERSAPLDTIIEAGEYRYLINGHMHFRTMIHFESLTMINAGTLKGEHWPGFSIVDFEAQHVTGYDFTESGVSTKKTQQLVDPAYKVWSNTQAFNGNWVPVRLF